MIRLKINATKAKVYQPDNETFQNSISHVLKSLKVSHETFVCVCGGCGGCGGGCGGGGELVGLVGGRWVIVKLKGTFDFFDNLDMYLR